MILPCEVGVKNVLPAVKAIMARTIVQKHGYNEKQTAHLLGLTQSAVSRYISRERGSNLVSIENSPDIISLIDDMILQLIKEPDNREGVMELFCKTCAAIREKGLMCPKCQSEFSERWAGNCYFCRR
ncbi:MAG: transcriptional regulator [Methanocella sp.]